MTHVKAFTLALAALLVPVSLASSAAAQPAEDAPAQPAEDAPAQPAEDAQPDADKPDGADKPDAAGTEDKYDPIEKEGTAYRFIGLRFRNLIVPSFMIGLFADGGASVNVFTFGPEFTTRKDGLEINFALSYADYSMDPFLFKGKSDKDDAWEIVSSDMKLMYLTADLLYEIPLDKEKGRFSILIGGGVGLGIVFGNLYRNQARPLNANALDPEDVDQWVPCGRPATGLPANDPDALLDPGSGNVYCDSSNEHYGAYDEPSWANGGSKPSVFPWISLPQLSFRFKPIKQLQTRLDTGFSLSGFFVGMSAGYGL